MLSRLFLIFTSIIQVLRCFPCRLFWVVRFLVVSLSSSRRGGGTCRVHVWLLVAPAVLRGVVGLGDATRVVAGWSLSRWRRLVVLLLVGVVVLRDTTAVVVIIRATHVNECGRWSSERWRRK